jgi:hypothetical protein
MPIMGWQILTGWWLSQYLLVFRLVCRHSISLSISWRLVAVTKGSLWVLLLEGRWYYTRLQVALTVAVLIFGPATLTRALHAPEEQLSSRETGVLLYFEAPGGGNYSFESQQYLPSYSICTLAQKYIHDAWSFIRKKGRDSWRSMLNDLLVHDWVLIPLCSQDRNIYEPLSQIKDEGKVRCSMTHKLLTITADNSEAFNNETMMSELFLCHYHIIRDESDYEITIKLAKDHTAQKSQTHPYQTPLTARTSWRGISASNSLLPVEICDCD